MSILPKDGKTDLRGSPIYPPHLSLQWPNIPVVWSDGLAKYSVFLNADGFMFGSKTLHSQPGYPFLFVWPSMPSGTPGEHG
jgi:hypothetical protein